MTDALRKAAQDVVDCEQYQGSFYVTYRIEKLNALREALAAPAPDAGEDEALCVALELYGQNRAAARIRAISADLAYYQAAYEDALGERDKAQALTREAREGKQT